VRHGPLTADQLDRVETVHRLGQSVEAINARLRLIARRAFRFQTPDAMIALAISQSHTTSAKDITCC
jgi:hypothetical protein